MDVKTNMDQIFQKLGDLKSFFIFGQNLMPTLQKILDFMKDTVPLLETVNRSISESTNRLPKAAIQIDSVTNATEVATTEILDVVDGVTNDLNTIQSKLNFLKEKLFSQKISLEKLAAKYPNDPDVEELMKNGINPEMINEDFVSVIILASKIQEGMMNITLSLQVQDITSQQLSSVNHLVQSIQNKMASLLMDLSHKEVQTLDYQFPKELTFNANARYDKNNNSQELVDSLVLENQSRKSQKEIDELFANK
ncbi:MAG: protein phosphatase CheZ [Ignavibacteriales bacterium]|nr:protein phosphatase CheZ [Ignavibacteriales bacterium]